MLCYHRYIIKHYYRFLRAVARFFVVKIREFCIYVTVLFYYYVRDKIIEILSEF